MLIHGTFYPCSSSHCSQQKYERLWCDVINCLQAFKPIPILILLMWMYAHSHFITLYIYIFENYIPSRDRQHQTICEVEQTTT